MAYNREKIFKAIEVFLATNGSPLKKDICNYLVEMGLVGTPGTADRYVSAYEAANEAAKVVPRAPVDASGAPPLPDAIADALAAVVDATEALKIEVAVAFEEQTRQTSAVFGKVIATHSTLQQAELSHLSTEVDRLRAERDAKGVALLETATSRDEVGARLAECEANLSKSEARLVELNAALSSEVDSAGALREALEARDKMVAILESDRDRRDRELELAGRDLDLLRGQVQQLAGELEQRRKLEERLARTEAERDANESAWQAELARGERLEGRLMSLSVAARAEGAGHNAASDSLALPHQAPHS